NGCCELHLGAPQPRRGRKPRPGWRSVRRDVPSMAARHLRRSQDCLRPAASDPIPARETTGRTVMSRSPDRRLCMMTYSMKAHGCDPQHIKGMSEKLIVSHYENNYGGAVKRLNAIEEHLAGLDFAKVPGFV